MDADLTRSSSLIQKQSGEFAPMLCFDAKANEQINFLREGLLSSGLANGQDLCPPHISIGFSRELAVREFEIASKRTLAPLRPFSLAFSNFGTFANGGVLFLAPVVTSELLDLQKDLYGVFQEMGAQFEEYYAPGSFVPHLTLGMGIPDFHLGDAISFCRQNITLPFTASIKSFSVYDAAKSLRLINHDF